MKENQSLEWKLSWRDEYLKWIAGFANAKGGRLFIGIDDSGTIQGVEHARKLLEDIPNKIKNLLGLVVDVNLLTEGQKEYLEIKVDHSSNPISYKGSFY